MSIQSQNNRSEHKKTKKPIAPTYIALLLILAEGSAHAWHIKKILDERGFEEWVDMKTSTIYKSLGILEQNGLIKGQKEEEGLKRTKKVYEITEFGMNTLLEQIQLCITNPPKSKSMFDLGIAGLSLLSKSSALSALEKQQTNLKYTLQWFESILHQFNNLDQIVETHPDQIIAGAPARVQQQNPNLFIIKALFERPYYLINAQKKWIDEFIQSIKEDQGVFAFKEE